MTNSKNDWCFRQMSSRERKTIGFETIFFKNMSTKKILKVIKFQGKSSSTREKKQKKQGGGGAQFDPFPVVIGLAFCFYLFIYLFIQFFAPLVLFFPISLSQFFHKKNLIQTKYFLLEKNPPWSLKQTYYNRWETWEVTFMYHLHHCTIITLRFT